MDYDITRFRYDNEDQALYVLVDDEWIEVREIRVFKNLGDLAIDCNRTGAPARVSRRGTPVEKDSERYYTNNDIAQLALESGVMLTVEVTPPLRKLLEKVFFSDAGRFEDFTRWDNI